MTQLRFGLGKNWQNFLSVVDESRIAETVSALKTMTGCDSLSGLSFLGIGGYPFEVAKPGAIFSLSRDWGYRLDRLQTCASSIFCNEFVFSRTQEPGA
jgi:hypothetical protein